MTGKLHFERINNFSALLEIGDESFKPIGVFCRHIKASGLHKKGIFMYNMTMLDLK